MLNKIMTAPKPAEAAQPWANLFSSFPIYQSALRQRRTRQIPQISSGINWLELPDCLARLMDFETRQGLSYRHYTAAGGVQSTCQVLARYEALLGGADHHRAGLRVAQSTGSAQAIATAMAILLEDGISRNVLLVGECYPIFHHQASIQGCAVVQSDREDGDLPPLDRLIDDIRRLRPALVVLAIPANPSGACYPVEDLQAILRATEAVGGHLLLDKVGLLFADQELAQQVGEALLDWIAEGRAVMIDSLSKSESLAGYRLGHILGNRAFIARYVKRQQDMIMNPPTVLALAIPLIYLARATALTRRIGGGDGLDRRAGRFLRASLSMLDDDCRERILGQVDPAFMADFVEDYITHHQQQRQTMAANKAYAVETLRPLVDRFSDHRAGMNFVIEVDRLRHMDEVAFQYRLAHDYGVFVLTQRCFSALTREGNRRRLRVRLSVGMPPATFREGIDRLADALGHIE